jgi:hypothetical protein
MQPAIRSKPRSPGQSRKAAVAACVLSSALLALATFAQTNSQENPSSYEVKAAYLFNLGRFLRITGDPNPQRRPTFDICVLGRDSMGHALDDLAAHQSINDRPVRIVRVADAYAAHECDIVFISPAEGDGIPLDLDALGKADVLTVSDSPDFIRYGGMIQFVTEDSHLRFAVNLDAVSRTHIVLSSELLRVASSVIGKPPPEEQP